MQKTHAVALLTSFLPRCRCVRAVVVFAGAIFSGQMRGVEGLFDMQSPVVLVVSGFARRLMLGQVPRYNADADRAV